jgi:GT2 family glycosyltransferase
LSERERMLDEIMTSTGWVVLRMLWDWRTRLVPHGSARDRALWLLLTTYRTFKTTGPGGVVGLASRGVQHALLSAVRSGVVAILPPRLAVFANSRMPTSSASPTANPVQPAVDDVAVVSRILEQAPPAPLLTIPSSPLPGRYDVIILPIIDWNFRFQRPQQIATRFAAAGHRVFYVASTFRDGPGPSLRPVYQGVVEVQLPGPPGLSIYANELEEPLLSSVITVMAALRSQFQIHDAVSIVDLPFWTLLAERLRTLFGWKLVYDCLDDYGGFTNISERMLRAEAVLTQSSDLVLATSRHLLAKQRERNPATIFVPNAAHFQHFRFGSNVPPSDIESLGHPIVGYYGAISDWFDTRLVGYLARARPQWEFVLVGSTAGAQLEPLRGLSNVHLLGEKPYRTLPGYLHAFDVCIIPFRRTPLTDATNPVKLFEYLSAGKRIIATELSELAYYRDYVDLVSDRTEWLQALDAVLAAPNPETDVLRRVDFARANDWDDRIQVIQQHIASLFPLVSIIVVSYNNLDYTRLCLDSIYAKTTYPSFEVVVVDNASSDGTQDYLRQFAGRHPNFKFLLNENNEGFARANNLGVEVASGDYVLFLNNDTIVSPGWLSRLIYYLRDPEIGMVGPVTNSSGNESRINVDYRVIDEIDAFAENYTRAHDGKSFDIRMLALFCVAVRRSTIEAVGNLDERFGIGTFEDDDYSMRIRALSLRIVCAEDVYIHHWGGASFSRLNRDDYQRIFTENRQKFEEKWGIAWEPHRYRTAL